MTPLPKSPHLRSREALFRALRGEKTPFHEYKKLLGNPQDGSKPSPGSKNWVIEARWAAVINGHISWPTLLPYLTGANNWGHESNENGSLIYGSGVLCCVLAGREWAERQGLTELVGYCTDWLRVYFVKLALGAVNYNPQGVKLVVGKESTSQHNPARHKGKLPLHVSIAGERQIEIPKGLGSGYTDVQASKYSGIYDNLYVPLLERAMGGRKIWSLYRGSPAKWKQGKGSWALWMVDKIRFPEFGSMIKGIMTGEEASLRHAVEVLNSFPIPHTRRWIINGNTRMSVLDKRSNRGKPGCSIVHTTPQESHWICPASFARSKAAITTTTTSVDFGGVECKTVTKGKKDVRWVFLLDKTRPTYHIEWGRKAKLVIYDRGGATSSPAPVPASNGKAETFLQAIIDRAELGLKSDPHRAMADIAGASMKYFRGLKLS